MKKLLYTLIIAGFGHTSLAQQMYHTNFANQNKVAINPAFTGTSFNFDVIGGQRLQWTGIEGAPSTTYLSVDALAKNTMGVGGNVVMDRTNMYNYMSTKFNYAYHIEVDRFSWLSFGLGMGVMQSSFAPKEVIATDYSDELIQKNVGGLGFDADFGIAYFRENLRVGISIPQMLQNRIKIEENALIESFGLRRHINFFAALDLEMDEKFMATPSFNMRAVPKASSQFDVGVMITYDKTFWANVAYRQQSGIIIGLGTHYNEKYLFGYSYELPWSGVTKYGSGSHEIYLGYRIKSNYKSKGPAKKVSTKLPTVQPDKIEGTEEKEEN
jgi:type IX secretion system PorP/SprF family membrane protein